MMISFRTNTAISPIQLLATVSFDKTFMDLQTSTSPKADPRLGEAAPDVPSTDDSELGQHDVSEQLSREATQIDHDPEKAGIVEGDEGIPGFNEQKSLSEKNLEGLVEFNGPNDPDSPKNFSKGRKWAITFSVGWLTFVTTFASSIFSVCTDVVSQEFAVDRVVSTLGVSLFLLVRGHSCHSQGFIVLAEWDS